MEKSPMQFRYILLIVLLVSGCGQQTPEPAGAPATAETTESQAVEDSAAEEIASQVPDTDIFILGMNTQGMPDTASLRNLTARPGYDNQPAFLPGGQQLIFSSIRGELQSDVYVLDIQGGKSRRLTRTVQSEYSPTPLPGGGFSVVRVEEDGSQRLWVYNADGSPGEMLVSELDNVGYHLWLPEKALALFLVGEPMKLVLGNSAAPGVRLLATEPGRSFARDPRTGMLYYLMPSGQGRWTLTGRDLGSDEQTSYLETPGESQDMALDRQGRVWMASGTALWRWEPGQSEWEAVADFGDALGGTITRLSFNQDDSRLAMVVSMESPEAQ
jgi:dipeptidyl aminopeptidase/acylaminoacyl peptidase